MTKQLLVDGAYVRLTSSVLKTGGNPILQARLSMTCSWLAYRCLCFTGSLVPRLSPLKRGESLEIFNSLIIRMNTVP